MSLLRFSEYFIKVSRQTVVRSFTYPWRIGGNRRTTVPGRYVAWVEMVALLVALVAYGSSSTAAIVPSALAASLSLPSGVTRVGAAAVNPTDWTTYHRDNTRAGYLASMADPRGLTRAWSASLDGAVYGEPLFVGGDVIVATEGDSLYSLNPSTGMVIWRTNVGQPVPLSTLPCGNINPLGITGTPVYDPATNLVFAVAEVTGPAHILVGVDATTGQVVVNRSADPAGMDPIVQQQRGALALSQGMVYVAYGGLGGDCGDYHGWVVASRTDGTGALLSYQVPTTREGGIWAASGPAVDASGNIFVAVGNGAATSNPWDLSDSVLRLSPTLQLQDDFAPTQWPTDNIFDQDLGSMGPLLLSAGLVYANGKSGLGYLLQANALGGVGGRALVRRVCHAYGGAAAFGLVLFVPCTEGLQQVKLGPGGVSLTLGWRAPAQVAGSPVVGGNTVYSLDTSGGTLYALDKRSGTVRATVSVGTTSRFATPTLASNRVFVGTLTGVVAVVLS